jgi:DNA-binding NarL/FixJ family response regulator
VACDVPPELEVLWLVPQSMRNAQIAERLVASEKTVHQHVSAILRNLGVPTHGPASVDAARLGLTGSEGQPP